MCILAPSTASRAPGDEALALEGAAGEGLCAELPGGEADS